MTEWPGRLEQMEAGEEESRLQPQVFLGEGMSPAEVVTGACGYPPS